MKANKICALWIAVCLLMSGISVFGQAQSQDDTEFAYELEVIAAAGLWKDDYASETPIDRAQFAKIVLELFQFDDITDHGGMISYYSDVSPADSMAPFINMATELGYMNGTEKNLFEPNSVITVEQAMVVLMRAMGYRQLAEVSGGFSIGYRSKRVSSYLLDSISNKTSEPLTSHVLAKLIYNAMDIAMLETVAAGGNMQYSDANGRTLLTMRDMYIGEGIVTANNAASLTSDSRTADGEVMIDEIRYEIGETVADALLGYRVHFLCQQKENQEQRTLLYIYDLEKYNKILKIDAKDLLDFSFLDRKYQYLTASGVQRSVSFAKDADVIYNGSVAAIGGEQFLPADGSVVLVDSTRDGVYNTVIIQSFTHIFVSRVDLSSGVIFDQDSAARTIDLHLNNSDYTYRIADAVGISRQLYTIQANDVLSAAVSADGKHTELIIQRQQAVGQLSSHNEKDHTVFVGEQKYELDERMIELESDLKLGADTTVYLDHSGRIAASKTEKLSSVRFGYLIDMATIDTGLQSTVKFKIYTQDGAFVVLTAAESFTVDGRKFKASTVNQTELKNAVFTDDKVNQMVRFRIGEDNILRELDTIKTTEFEQQGDCLGRHPYLDAYPQGGLSSGPAGSMTYYKSAKTFSFRVYVTDDVPIFNIPIENLEEKSMFDVFPASELTNRYENVIDAYNTDGDIRFASAILMEVRIGDTTYTENAHVGVVTDIGVSVDKNGDLFKTLYTVTASGNESVTLKNPSDSDPTLVISDKVYAQTYASGNVVSEQVEVKKGDMVRYMVDSNNCTYALQMVVDSGMRKFYNPTTNSAFLTKTRMTAGVVEEFTKDVLSVKNVNLYSPLSNGAAPYEYYPSEGCSIITVDFSDRDKDSFVSKGSSSDVREQRVFGDEASWLIFYTREAAPQLIVLYNGLDTVPNDYLDESEISDSRPRVGLVCPY